MAAKSGRYRKVSTRIWTDDKFLDLTPIQPSGQSLFLWLLCGPLTTQIPGCISAGPAAAYERLKKLKWEEKGFRKAFEEVLSKGLIQHDDEGPLIWLPNALIHNPPQNPNVILSWSDTWHELPECELKKQVKLSMYSRCSEIGEAFGKAFEKSIGKPL